MDEKFPYLYLNCIQAMPEREIILLIDGNGYKPGALAWLKQAVASQDAKLIHVFNLVEFLVWANRRIEAKIKCAVSPLPASQPVDCKAGKGVGRSGFSGKALASAFFKLRSRFVQVRNEVKELRLLFEVLQILDSASDLSDNLETVLEVMAEHTGMMRGVITLLDEAHGEIAIEAAYGMSAEAQSKGRYKLGEGITGKVIESGKPLVIPNVLVEPLFLNRTGSRSRKEAVSFICVPVKMEGRVIGALSADRLFAASEALEEDMRLLSVLASLISKAVKNRQERHRMLEENRRLLDVLRERSRPEMFVGRSPGLRPS